MKSLALVCFVATMSAHMWAQQSAASPLGVLVSPPAVLQVPKAVRDALPNGAKVRILAKTTLTADGEDAVVFEMGNEYEPDSHVAFVKGHVMVANFSLGELFLPNDIGTLYASVKAVEIRAPDGQDFLLSAFRNIGDGSGTIFVLVAFRNGKYQVVWKDGVTQGRFRVLPNGQIQLWGADGEGQCVWCPQRYHVTTFEWKNGQLAKVGQYNTKKALSPGTIADRPIVLDK